jgi:predicted DNA-binding protein (UPF0278 family)
VESGMSEHSGKRKRQTNDSPPRVIIAPSSPLLKTTNCQRKDVGIKFHRFLKTTEFSNCQRKDVGIKFYRYHQNDLNGKLIESMRLEHNVTVNIPSSDYKELKKAFESKLHLKVQENSLINSILMDVNLGKRLLYTKDSGVTEFYTYTAQLKEEINKDVMVTDSEYHVHGVGLNLGHEKNCINMVMKVCHKKIDCREFYEKEIVEHKAEQYDINLHLQETQKHMEQQKVRIHIYSKS